jgi:hypothetical protein
MSENAESRKVGAKLAKRITRSQSPDQESEQIKKLVHEWSMGFSQDLQGQAIHEFIAEFLGYFSEETRREIEEAVKTLHPVKDFGRFRRKMIAVIASAYANGVHDGRVGSDFDYEEMGRKAGSKVRDKHKGVLRPIS